MTLAQWLQQAQTQLASVSDSARLDAELLLMHVLKCTRAYLFTWPEKPLTQEQSQQLDVLLERRLTGHPIAHITSEREFWGLALKVTADTLIPRPDTEILVEQALEKLSMLASPRIIDLGTGTGAIALALASECPNATIYALDQSDKALAVAQENGERLQLKVNWVHSDWFKKIDPQLKFDLIVSNPPYIETDDPHLSQGDVRFEPISALTSGSDGLDDIRTICAQAPDYLNNGGWLMIEHGYNQKQAIQRIFLAAGFSDIHTQKDYGDNDRVTLGRLTHPY